MSAANRISARSTRLGFAGVLAGIVLACQAGAPTDAEEIIVNLDAVVGQIEVSDTVRFTARVTNGSGNVLTNPVSWSSSNPSVAQILSDGSVIGLAPGQVTLSAAVDASTKSATLIVVPPAVKELRIAAVRPVLRVTQSVQAVAELRDKRGRPILGRAVIWASNTPGVASVNAAGVIAALTPGDVIVSATSEGQSALVNLSVTTVPVISVTALADVGLLVSQSTTLTATPRDSVGGAIAGLSAEWTTSDATIASITQAGVVTAVGVGGATITAKVAGVPAAVRVAVAAVPIASISVSPVSASRIVTQTATFSALAKDSIGAVLSGRAIIWTTTNAAVATVDAAGVVTAAGPGTASIIASSGGRSTSASFTVAPVPVVTVSVNPPASILLVGESVSLTVTMKDSLARVLFGRATSWSSSAPTVATVSAAGAVSVVGPGDATISATSEGRVGSATISSRLRVGSVTISPSPLTLLVGQTRALVATPRDTTGAALTDRGIAWSSSDALVATVSGTGSVVAKLAGTATITASSEGSSVNMTLTVVPVPVASVTVAPSSRNLFLTQTVLLSAAPVDSIGGALAGRTVVWTTSSAAIATVSPTGLVTAVTPGTAVITATVEGKVATASIVSAPVPIVTVTLTAPRTALLVGEDMQLVATPRDSVGGALTGRVVTFASSAPAVLGSDATGFVVALTPGASTVTALAEGKSITLDISVAPVPVRSVLVSPSAPFILNGTTVALTATPRDSAGRALLDRAVTWSTATPAIASVSPLGVVTALAQGVATIIGTSEGQVGGATISVVNALYPNEPVDLLPISERSFTSLVEGGWTTAFDTSLTITSDAGAPKSPTSIGVVRYNAGFIAGNEPVNLFRVLPAGTDTLYVSFWVKFSDNWVGHPASGVNKILHVFVAGRNRVVLAAFGSNASPLIPQIRLQEISSHSGFVNFSPNLVPGARIVRGQWHRWEMLLKSNTASDANGSVEWWLDGVKVGQVTDIAFVPATLAHNWTSLNWAPTWGGVGGTMPALQTQALDHIWVSGK